MKAEMQSAIQVVFTAGGLVVCVVEGKRRTELHLQTKQEVEQLLAMIRLMAEARWP